MKDFKKLREEALRQQQRQQEVFKEGDAVMSSRTGVKGHIHRVGGNYAIVISEEGNMFREWIKNIRSINNTRRTSLLNDEVSEASVNNVNSNDEFSSGLMESYSKWMGGDCFQNSQPVDLNLSEAPFDGMDPQSNGAEIEDTTKRKKGATKKGAYVGQEAAPKNEEVLEREEYEVDGETYVIEKKKGLDGKACWKGYKLAGTKKKGGKTVDNCVKAGDELTHDGEELSEKKLDPVNHKELKGKHADRKDKDIDNDGDVDGSDKYLHMRRKKVSKIIAMKGKK